MINKIASVVVLTPVAHYNSHTYRHLSCQACYDVSDVGLACLSSCTQLAELNFSYCNKVSTRVPLKKVGHFHLPNSFDVVNEHA